MTIQQNPISVIPIDSGAPGWDVVMQANMNKLNDYIKTFKFTITVDGNTGLPSELEIQLQNGAATPVDVLEEFILRCRVSDNDAVPAPDEPAWGDATNATISSVLTGTIIETFTATKDLLIESDANGLIKLELTDAVAELFWLVIGPSYITPTFANYENGQQLDHV